MRSSFLFRSRIIAFLIILLSGAVVTRLFWVQVVHGDYYGGVADRQYVTPSQNVYERGTIYWQRKDGELISAAAQISGFKLAINPMKIADAAEVYKKVKAIIPMSREDFLSKASKENDPYEEVAQRLTRETVDAVSALKIPGLSVFKEKWRSYPGGDLAAHTLGFVGYKGDELGGRYGLGGQDGRGVV